MKSEQTINLSDIHFGHEFPGVSINSRLDGREAEIKELAASIAGEGLIQPLGVIDHEGTVYVVDGNRRLAALRTIMEEVPSDWLYFITVENPADAISKSLAANVMHVPLHPVDRYEAFAGMRPTISVEEIAARYGCRADVVRRSLALGALCDKIRAAWRADEIDAEIAKAFTVEPDHEKQAKVFDQLKRRNSLFAYNVRQELVGSQPDAESLLKFVGKLQYVYAGGAIGDDLFADDGHGRAFVSDYQKLVDLTRAKLIPEADKALEQGWGWATLESDMPVNWRFSGEWVIGGEIGTKADKGCVVTLKDGAVELISPVSKPQRQATAERREETKAKVRLGTEPPKALQKRMEEWQARAIQSALHQIMKGAPAVTKVLALIVTNQINPERMAYTPNQVLDRLTALRDTIDVEFIGPAMLKNFDQADYFKTVPIKLVERALKEMSPEVDMKGPPASLRAVAAARATKSGWLPKELRHTGYAGPKATREKKAKA